MGSHSQNSENQIHTVISGILNDISDIIFIIDDNLKIIGATESCKKLFNANSKQISGQSLLNFKPEYWSQNNFQEAFNSIKSGNTSALDIEIEIDLDTKFKRLVPINLHRIPFKNDIGPIIIVTLKKLLHPDNLLHIDKQDKDQIQKMAYFSIEYAPDAVFWTDQDAKFIYVNEQACRSLGYSRDELLKLHLWDIDPIFPRDKWLEVWNALRSKEAIDTERVQSIQRRKDGTEFPVEVSSRHIILSEDEFHVAFVRDISKQKKYEKDLKITQSAIQNATIACFLVNEKCEITFVNEQACNSLGYTNDELLGMSVFDIDPEFTIERWQNCWNEIKEVKAKIFESSHQRKDGTIFPVELTVNYLEYDSENYSGVYARDISTYRHAEEEKTELEMQLYQAQKMETVGRLAGGIAHDFNNMLSVILGYIEMLRDRLSNDPQCYEDLIQMEKAANHSKEITRQLLAFSRKQIISPKPLNINDLVENTEKTLIRLIGEDIQLEFNPCPDVWTINFDPSQLDQIFVNLAVNARDAMPHGGKLLISTNNIHADETYCRYHVEVDPGDYVLLTISDNGIGMDRETLSYIFEPFFTTKSVDQGTGLGLATVYGIMMQNNGYINVQSEPNIGTTFNLYIPRLEQIIDEKGDDQIQTFKNEPATGTILLVEDDEMLRRMTTLMLEEIGYTVLPADGPINAIKKYRENKDKIDLLMTDVVMPNMSGIELKEEISKENPAIRTLFMSGYASNVIVDYGILEDGVNFIQKPFSMKNLNSQIRDILGLE